LDARNGEGAGEGATRETCVVVCPRLTRGSAGLRSAEGRLAEAVGLAEAIGLEVRESETVPVPRPRPATLFGAGTVDRLAALIRGVETENGAIDVVLVDAQLSPVQQRNLEKAWDCKVIDRTGMILEIFGERARTAEGRLQVELAALSYQRSRLVRSWAHLERQRGGFGFMGGPGEAQIETDRRLIGDRIARLRRELAEVKRTRSLHREARRRVPYPVIALVGYTNAGKSTLFNRLTQADVVVRDQVFATLDPTMRGLDLPSGRMAILSDTVGFISELPHELVEAFHATLEEVTEADIVVHVRDIAHPDTAEQKRDVHRVLAEMGLSEAADNGMIEVLNKIDLVGAEDRETLFNQATRANVPSVPVSARTGEGCDTLLATLDERLSADSQIIDIALAPTEGAALAWLYDHGEVMAREDGNDGVHLRVRLSTANAARFARRREQHTD